MTREQEILTDYRLIVMEIETLERQSKFLNKYIGGPKPVRSPQITGMPRGTNDPEAARLQRADYDDAIYKIEQKSEELRELVSEFEQIMELVQDKEDALILRDYYALGWTDIKIGRALGYDKSTIWKRRSKAIRALDD